MEALREESFETPPGQEARGGESSEDQLEVTVAWVFTGECFQHLCTFEHFYHETLEDRASKDTGQVGVSGRLY